MEEKIRENLKKFREGAGLSQRQLAALAGKSEGAIQAYESGRTDIPLSALISVMGVLKISFADLERGSKAEAPVEKPVEILIYNQEDRLNTAAILIKNGYTVEQGKRQRTQTGKTLDYFLKIRKYSADADTSR
ncbi:MAG: helix-turn-helix transcriptional regulator [Lachnospiraceae bacterium]|nr:helix-turn-helix transcriptional regulator [Lachnospiraceae bacterium]